MPDSFIRPLKSLSSKDGDLVGGKSANLGELFNAGLPVPDGFAITTLAYKKLVIESESKTQIEEILNTLDIDDFNSINSCSDQIRQVIEAIPLSEDLISEISSSYASLGDNVEVAVRSSATAEDLPTASFAGQMDSFLYIKGIDNVLKSVKKCLSSVFSSRAISYRHEKNFDHFLVLASITVQKMLDPESAGVMFTLNPVSGNKNEIYILESDNIKPISIKTEPYPGFPTDLQAQIMVLMTKAQGISKIKENIFENRFMHVSELRRMGAHIEIKGNKAIVFGRKKLNGAELMATDLRASVCLVLAGLVASKKTIVNRIYHLDRGYEKIEAKLSKCRAQIKRLQ